MLARLLKRVVPVKDEEIAALLWSFGYFLTLLAGYSILRPIRDEMGVASGARNLPWLYTGTFFAMLVVVPIYSWLVARVPRARLVPLVYHFFALNLVAFFALWRLGVAPLWTGRVFFVWTSVYNLFVVSVLWSVMADTWRSEQGKRLFGFVAAGGSVGGLIGPTLTTALVGPLGPANLILVSAIILELSVVCVKQVRRHAARAAGEGAAPAREVIGGGILSGIKHALSSPFLLGICVYVLLFTVTSTFLYNQQAHLFERFITDRAERTRVFALEDLVVNVGSMLVQAGVTGHLVVRLGMGVALAALPIFTLGAFGIIVLVPTVLTVAIFYVARRVVHFAIDRPAREVLFTVVPPEDKYKTKSFIDTAVYRGGDLLGAWSFAALASAAIPAALPLTLGWLVVAIYLARRFVARQGAKPS